jgi:hypothetical protein
MKMIKNLSFLLLLAASVLSLQSCKKENGLQSYNKTSSNWNCSSLSCEANLIIPELTSEIMNDGLVMVYMSPPAGSGVTGNVPLPAYATNESYLVTLIEVGNIRLRYEDNLPPIVPTFNTFKVVLVENWKSANLQNIDKNDFKAVSKIASKIIDINIEK